MFLNDLIKQIEEKNKQLIISEKKKDNNNVNFKDSKSENIANVLKISLYDLYLMRKQVDEVEKILPDELKKLREEGNYKDYIALKYGSVINPSTLKRFVFPYVDPDDEDYPFMYGMVIRDILNGDIETLKRILNFD